MSTKKPQEIGRIAVSRSAVRIEDLQDKVDKAIAFYNKANDKYQKGVDSSREWDMVIKTLRAQIEEIRGFLSTAYHNRGIVHMGEGHIEEAIQCLELAVKANPQFALAFHNLGLMYKEIGDPLNADKNRHQALKLGYVPKSDADEN